jgi:acetylornithine deacetylase/succinyl-diaminopimelate desuccinylase-like protein
LECRKSNRLEDISLANHPRFGSSINILRKLTEFPTYEASGMRHCAEFLAGELEDLGFSSSLDKLNSVYAEKTFQGGQGAFLINTHFDTVPSSSRWARDPLRASLEDGRLYGLGTADAKGGIAATLHALERMEDCRFRKLEILFSNYEDNNITIDGETWLGTPYFLGHHPLQADGGINVEGTVKGEKFMVSLGCGGRVGFTVTTMGREAHSSDPRLGRNAIYDMVKVIEALRRVPRARMTLDDYEALTELNVSVINGGTAINIVPGECRIICERRVLPNEDWDEVKKEVDQALSTVQGVNFKTDFYKPQKSYLLDRNHPVVTLAVDSTLKAVGYKPQFRVEAGRTDSTYIDHLAGIKTIILGPGETENEHAPDEFINIKRLEEFTEIMYHMLSKPH